MPSKWLIAMGLVKLLSQTALSFQD